MPIPCYNVMQFHPDDVLLKRFISVFSYAAIERIIFVEKTFAKRQVELKDLKKSCLTSLGL